MIFLMAKTAIIFGDIQNLENSKVHLSILMS